MNKDVRVIVRLTNEQCAVLRMAAGRDELDLSTWMRQTCLFAARQLPLPLPKVAP